LNQRDNILAQVLTVPSLPVAAVKVISVLQKPNAELCEIARVINHDPGLATNGGAEQIVPLEGIPDAIIAAVEAELHTQAA